MLADIEIRSNVVVTLRERGKLVGRHHSHNIFLDQGRDWLSKMIGAKTYPDPPEGDVDMGGTAYAVDGMIYKVRYIGVGIGGSKQNYYPPGEPTKLGPGSQTESDPSVTGLERPIEVTAGVWMKQVLPQVATDLLSFPSKGKIVFRVIYDMTEINFAEVFDSAPADWGTMSSIKVPISEFALYTSQANPGLSNGGTPPDNGCIAYNTDDTRIVTPNMMLEVDWTFTF